ncbi:hypothetical protein BsWGS_13237 [Bradybaena similaris]
MFDSLQHDVLTTELDHGEACQSAGPTNQCKLDHTICLPSFKQPSTTKCLCDSGFFWGSSSGPCISRENLKITANISWTTTNVTFVWSQVPARSDVSYSITWGNSNTWNASNSGATVTGLDPGTSYNFSVVTSLPGDDNYDTVTISQSQTPVWTKPGKPGPVTEVSRVDSSTYKVTFVKSNGSVSLYIMEVSKGETFIETQRSTLTTMYFTKLEPATVYTYSLWSQNGIKERSDPVTDSFNTTPEASGPVSRLNSMGVQSHTANVTWQPPSKPNGIITGYLVEVALQAIEGCVYYIKVDQVVINDINLPSCNLTNAVITSSNNVYNLELPHLKPYRNYTVTVRAFNERGLGDPATVPFQTDISAPNDISELTVNSERDESTQKVNLNIAWKPGEQTGPTDYYIHVEALELDSGGSNQSSSPYIVTGYSNNTYVKHDVLAYWRYNISVWAHTDKGNSSLKFAKNSSTVETNPGAVKNLNVTQDSLTANIVTLTFECPDRMSRNGIIEKFVITQTLLNPQTSGEDEKSNFTQNITGTPCSSQYEVPAENIIVERNYSFSVMTVNNKYEGGVSNYPRFYVQPKAPQLINLIELFKVDALVKLQDGSTTELTKINTEVCSPCLTDVRWGRVVNVGILVCVGNCTATGRQKRSGPEFTSFKSWRDAKKERFVSEYRTTPDNWIPTINGNNIYTKFVVGENTNCSEADVGYCNGPLPGGDREYIISVIMCTTAGCTIYREREPFRTYAPPGEPSHVGAIVGGVLGGLALIAVIGVIIFLVWHFRRRNGRSPGRHPVAGNEGSKEIIRKRPVKMRDFNDHVTRFHKDSNLLFQDEFESIRTVSESFKNTCDESKREQNRVKNRYADILPYDHSRVKLDILSDDDDTNDFINANYIPGYNSVREFIATQGPMYSTIPDFWKMVWEQKCKMIVMLSDLTEAGKRKVDLYWPESLNEPINYGTVVVEMTNFSQLNKYIIRNFKLIKGEETRKVTHYFLPGWPDFGAAISFDDVLGFVKAVRQEVTPANEGPIVVHCSAGVGRSGTFIALDYFAQFVEEHSLDDSIDVFDFVLQMRKNRTKMVQVEMQYIFIYDSINKLIQNKIKSEEEKLYENLSTGNGVYENFKQQEENIYANTTVEDDKYVYNNEAFEPDFGQSQKSDKPITEL